MFLILFFFTSIAGKGCGKGERDSAHRKSSKNRKGPTVLMGRCMSEGNLYADQGVTERNCAETKEVNLEGYG